MGRLGFLERLRSCSAAAGAVWVARRPRRRDLRPRQVQRLRRDRPGAHQPDLRAVAGSTTARATSCARCWSAQQCFRPIEVELRYEDIARHRAQSRGPRRHVRRVTRLGLLGGTFDPAALRAPARRAGSGLPAAARARAVPASAPEPAQSRRAEQRRPRTAARWSRAPSPTTRSSSCRAWISIVRHRRIRPICCATLNDARRPSDELFFLVGADILPELPRWRTPDEILRLARLVVVNRPGSPPPDLAALEAASARRARPRRPGPVSPASPSPPATCAPASRRASRSATSPRPPWSDYIRDQRPVSGWAEAAVVRQPAARFLQRACTGQRVAPTGIGCVEPVRHRQHQLVQIGRGAVHQRAA